MRCSVRTCSTRRRDTSDFGTIKRPLVSHQSPTVRRDEPCNATFVVLLFFPNTLLLMLLTRFSFNSVGRWPFIFIFFYVSCSRSSHSSRVALGRAVIAIPSFDLNVHPWLNEVVKKKNIRDNTSPLFARGDRANVTR